MSEDEDYARSLADLCNAVLESVVAVFETYGVEVPERQYITTGAPVHDCSQLTVSLQQLYLGPPGDQAQRPQKCDAPRTAFLSVSLVRDVPAPVQRTGRPTAQSLQESGERQMIDAYLLLKAGAEAVDQWGLGVLADVSPGEAAGGMQAMLLNVTLAVP